MDVDATIQPAKDDVVRDAETGDALVRHVDKVMMVSSKGNRMMSPMAASWLDSFTTAFIPIEDEADANVEDLLFFDTDPSELYSEDHYKLDELKPMAKPMYKMPSKLAKEIMPNVYKKYIQERESIVWTYSAPGAEIWAGNCDTREEAIAQGRACFPGGGVIRIRSEIRLYGDEEIIVIEMEN